MCRRPLRHGRACPGHPDRLAQCPPKRDCRVKPGNDERKIRSRDASHRSSDKRKRSRDASASEFLPRHATNHFASGEKGRRSADRRHIRSAPLRVRRRALSSPPALAREKLGGVRPPFGAPPRFSPRFHPRLNSGRASWNHRMQTGGPSPAPVQRAPRSPITRRTGRCPKPPARAVYRCARENRSRSASRSTLAKASFVERDFASTASREQSCQRRFPVQPSRPA
jgi:hypothetical protein